MINFITDCITYFITDFITDGTVDSLHTLLLYMEAICTVNGYTLDKAHPLTHISLRYTNVLVNEIFHAYMKLNTGYTP